MLYINSEKVIIKSWCNNPEDGAIEQAKNLANLPFIFHHVALMPDTHQGYGMPIGGVIATTDVVIPNAVGVDIGCGMQAIKTSIVNISTEQIKTIMSMVREQIPVGFNHHEEKQEWNGFNYAPVDIPIVEQQIESSKYQLGTLGGGNHFIELQKDEDDYLWVMVHSGSRNFGYNIAKEYNSIAQKSCKMWYSNIPECKGEDGLAFLPIISEDGNNYLRAMTFAMEFAKENRTRIIDKVVAIISNVLGNFGFDIERFDIHHNYARIENHFGKNVMVHRKGATLAVDGIIGIIPGSQGSNSYIVKGLGNAESFNSCSHGAGRKMSRSKAHNELDLNKEIENLNSKGIIHAIRNVKDLEEAPSAYKDIDVVMEEQKDLVGIIHKLRPIAVIKG